MQGQVFEMYSTSAFDTKSCDCNSASEQMGKSRYIHIYVSALQGHLTSRIDIYVNYALHKNDTLKERDGQGQATHESKFALLSMLYTELAGPIWICTYIC
jgi:hypothetical protein